MIFQTWMRLLLLPLPVVELAGLHERALDTHLARRAPTAGGVVGGAPGANPRRGRPRHERRGLREPLRPRAGRHLRGLGRTDRVRSMSMLAGGGSALVEGLRRDGRASRAGIAGI